MKKENDSTWEEIRSNLRDVSRLQKELSRSQSETDLQLKKTDLQLKKTDRQLEKSRLEVDRKFKEGKEQADKTLKSIKELRNLFTGQWGKLMETLVEGDLINLLHERGITVERTVQNIKGTYQGERWEIDILAVNGDEVVVVEVKTTMTVRDVDFFMEKHLENFTGMNPEYQGKKILGAIAYLKANQSSALYAEKQGLFVIRATGGSAGIINKKNFKPRVF
ncbi:MAG: hypothetical protein OXB84_02420 [Halobacteriovoraceae bacterium]|nr:hypothetical protein [Halobacteriovoraceae bacterium]